MYVDNWMNFCQYLYNLWFLRPIVPPWTGTIPPTIRHLTKTYLDSSCRLVKRDDLHVHVQNATYSISHKHCGGDVLRNSLREPRLLP